MTDGKPIAVLLQSISGVSAINSLVAFYDIHGRKREVLFFYIVPDTTRDYTPHNKQTVAHNYYYNLVLYIRPVVYLMLYLQFCIT
jgi:hypothetical protein